MSDEPPNRDDQTDPSTGDVEEGYADERDEPRGDWRAVLHRARVPITLAVLLVLMAGAAWYGWQALLSDPEPTTSSTSRECVTPEPGEKQEVSATEVSVNVFNAGGVSGLASRTAQALTSRGFTVIQVGNDREESHLSGVQIRGRAKDAPEVALVAAQVSDAEIVPDQREEAEVDLVVGADFKDLAKNAPTTLEVDTKNPMCKTPAPPKSPES